MARGATGPRAGVPAGRRTGTRAMDSSFLAASRDYEHAARQEKVRRDRERERLGRVALGRGLAYQALAESQDRPQRGILLAVEAVRTTSEAGLGVTPVAEAPFANSCAASAVKHRLLRCARPMPGFRWGKAARGRLSRWNRGPVERGRGGRKNRGASPRRELRRRGNGGRAASARAVGRWRRADLGDGRRRP